MIQPTPPRPRRKSAKKQPDPEGDPFIPVLEEEENLDDLRWELSAGEQREFDGRRPSGTRRPRDWF
jgi:hypothetical protein